MQQGPSRKNNGHLHVGVLLMHGDLEVYLFKSCCIKTKQLPFSVRLGLQKRGVFKQDFILHTPFVQKTKNKLFETPD